VVTLTSDNFENFFIEPLLFLAAAEKYRGKVTFLADPQSPFLGRETPSCNLAAKLYASLVSLERRTRHPLFFIISHQKQCFDYFVFPSIPL